jgi:hypothetical protein
MSMNLENLQQKQSNLLIQYKQAVADYLSFVQSPPSTSDMVSIQGRAFVGTGSAGQSTATTLQTCQADCAANSSCSGATFVSNQCVLQSGDAPLVPANQDTYAIVPKAKQLLLNMEALNAELIAINEQIQQQIDASKTTIDQGQESASLAAQQLAQSYIDLYEERSAIEQLLDEYNTLDATEAETDLKVTQRHYTYIILVAAAVVVLIILGMPSLFASKIDFEMGSNTISTSSSTSTSTSENVLGTSAYFILFLIIVVIVFLNVGVQYLSVNPLTDLLNRVYKWFPQTQIQPI